MSRVKKPSVVFASESLIKAIKKGQIPQHIADKFFKWRKDVQSIGIREVRKVPGYHDEPVRAGNGRRSVRMSQGWRLFYHEIENGECIIIAVEEINKHVYL